MFKLCNKKLIHLQINISTVNDKNAELKMINKIK